jgi:hypothetical protein
MKKQTVVDAFFGSANLTKTFDKSYEALSIANTGASDLTFTVGGITLKLPPGYKFDENVEPFNVVTVTATDSFIGYVRDEV